MRFTAALLKSRLSHAVVPAKGQIFTFPAPTGGWNARDPLSGMKPSDAIVLDNYFPTTADVELRGGSNPFATGMGVGQKVETLLDYSKGTTSEMWAVCNGKFYNVSNAGAVGAAAVSGQLSSRWQSSIFTTSGDTRIVAVDGEDDMRQYDGTTWHQINAVSAPIAITGVATSSLIQVWDFKERLFFVEKNSMKAWYLPTDSFGGAASSINLGTIFKLGGYLMAGGTWTRDGGDGMDDLCVFISSKGEVAIFAGSDPSDSDAWGMIGRYEIGAPVGRRCLIKTGADLAIISLDGILGLSTIISLDRAASNRVALSSKIRGAFSDATAMFKDNFGWEAISYPAKSQAIFNIPIVEGEQQYQFVLNTITGSWCRFKGQDGNTWCRYNERVYFGNNNGEVWISDDGQDDDGAEIVGFVKTAFVYHNGIAVKKNYKLVRPTVISDIDLPYGCDVVVNFNPTVVAAIINSPNLSGLSLWNIATWDVDPWSVDAVIQRWKKVKGTGACASILFSTSTAGFIIKLNSIDVLFEKGGIL